MKLIKIILICLVTPVFAGTEDSNLFSTTPTFYEILFLVVLVLNAYIQLRGQSKTTRDAERLISLEVHVKTLYKEMANQNKTALTLFGKLDTLSTDIKNLTHQLHEKTSKMKCARDKDE